MKRESEHVFYFYFNNYMYIFINVLLYFSYGISSEAHMLDGWLVHIVIGRQWNIWEVWPSRRV